MRSESTGQLPINGRLASLTVVEGDDARSERSDSPPPAVGYNATVDRILTDHLAAARSVVQKDSPALAQLEREIFEDCERLRDFLMAAKVSAIFEISEKRLVRSSGREKLAASARLPLRRSAEARNLKLSLWRLSGADGQRG